jgi:hypothetical protein
VPPLGLIERVRDDLERVVICSYSAQEGAASMISLIAVHSSLFRIAIQSRDQRR